MGQKKKRKSKHVSKKRNKRKPTRSKNRRTRSKKRARRNSRRKSKRTSRNASQKSKRRRRNSGRKSKRSSGRKSRGKRLDSSRKKTRRKSRRSKCPYRLRSRKKLQKIAPKRNKIKWIKRVKRRKQKTSRYVGELRQTEIKIQQALQKVRYQKFFCDSYEARDLESDVKEDAQSALDWANLKFRSVLIDCAKINDTHEILKDAYNDVGIRWENIVCGKCKSRDKDDQREVLLCDGPCMRAYHLECLEPPLTEVPEDEDWFCPQCELILASIERLGEIHGIEVPIHSYDDLQSLFPYLAVLAPSDEPLIGTNIIRKGRQEERYGTIKSVKNGIYKVRDADDGRRIWKLTREQIETQCKKDTEPIQIMPLPPEDDPEDSSFDLEEAEMELEEAQEAERSQEEEEDADGQRSMRRHKAVNYQLMAKGLDKSEDWGSDKENWSDQESAEIDSSFEEFSDDSDDWD